MRPPGRHRKDRRHGQKIGAGLRQRAVEMREAHIVAHGHAEPAPRRLGDDRMPAGTVGVALAVAFAARQVDVEHVDLVVARDDRAARVDQKRAVRQPVLLRGSLRLAGRVDDQRTEQQPRPGLARQLAHRRRGTGRPPRAAPSRAALAALDQVGVLGGQDEIGAGVARPPHQIGDRRRLGSMIRPGRELDAGGRERLPLMRRSPASESSSPARSSATMLVAAADMLAIDKDLRHRRAPAGAPDHLVAPRRLLDDVDFGVVDALALQQRPRARAQYGQNIVV